VQSWMSSNRAQDRTPFCTPCSFINVIAIQRLMLLVPMNKMYTMKGARCVDCLKLDVLDQNKKKNCKQRACLRSGFKQV